jgi:hypothetical protein
LIPSAFLNTLYADVKFRFTIIAFLVVAAVAQTGAERIAPIAGRIVNAQTRDPVRRVVIEISSPNNKWHEFSDAEGHFRFLDLKPGEYELIAHRDNFTDRSYHVERSDFDPSKQLTIELFPQGLIAGRVVDGFGQPLQSAKIQALRSGSRNGNLDNFASTDTNDLGEYRLSGLDPGTYRIRATYRDGQRHELDPTPITTASAFYGGSDKPAELVVKAGAVIGGIDFVLNPVRPATLRGTVRSDTGTAVDRAALWITGQAGEGAHNVQAIRGKFEIRDVSPGIYTISAHHIGTEAPQFGLITVDVRGEDVEGLDIVMRPSPKIEGRFRVEGGDVSSLKLGAIYFRRTDGVLMMGMTPAHAAADGTFEVVLHPGEYAFTFAYSRDNFNVQAVTLDDKRIDDWKLQIESSADPKKLTIVLKPKGKP